MSEMTKEYLMPELEHLHTPDDIKARLAEGYSVNYLREWVYGGIDGVVTTFAIIAGVTGASLSPMIVVILGIANLVGDGFSMAASAYSSEKTNIDNYNRIRKVEEKHIDKDPEGETEEILQIYRAKGFKGDDLEKVVKVITENREIWIETMLTEEYGISPLQKLPLKAGWHTFLSFLVCGAMPLLPFILHIPNAFEWALLLSSLTFFCIGGFKSLWSVHRWWKQGVETTIIGLFAAGLAFLIGHGLRGLSL